MKVCFLFALAHEMRYLLAHSHVLSEEQLGYARLYRMESEGHEFFACVSGVGKVLAGSAACQCALTHPEIDAFVNLGIGGSLDAEKAPLLSVVIGRDYVQHDFDTSALGDPVGLLDGIGKIRLDSDAKLRYLLRKTCAKLGVNCYEGTIASGDRFLVNDEDKAVVVREFGNIMIDMESAAFAEGCYVHHKPFCALRVVSDAVNHSEEYMQNRFPAGEKACEIGLAFLSLCA